MPAHKIASTLPRSLAKEPAIRAQTLSVFEKAPGYYVVPGRTGIYDVFIVAGKARCTCIAAQHQQRCAHAIASLAHYKRTVTNG